MAEQTVMVCDVCGKVPAQSVAFRVGRKSLKKDLCAAHLAELTAGARPAGRGRPRGAAKRATVASRQRKTRRKRATGGAAKAAVA